MIFQTFNSTDIVSGRVQPVSTGIWSGGEPQHTAFFTSSVQARATGSSQFDPLNGLYYLNVYDANPSSSLTAEVYFSVAYGHVAGSGSSNFDLDTNTGSLIKPTQAIYGQYRNLLLAPGDDVFTFYTGSRVSPIEVESPDIYVINFKSDKVKDRLDAGQFEITLRGTNGTVTFIDDSRTSNNNINATGGKRFNIVRGSLDGTSPSNDAYDASGAVYPDLGIIVLNPTVIARMVGATPSGVLSPTPTGSYAMMHQRLFSAIAPNNIGSITARVTEYVPSRHYFIRVGNQNFNYSNNPSFVLSAADDPVNAGTLRYSDFSTDPKVYITTVGLYSETNDLVAVAKLSQPILKDFASECLIKLRIDF